MINVANCFTGIMSPHFGDIVRPMTLITGKYVRAHHQRSRTKIGIRQSLIIPNSYHVPMAKSRILPHSIGQSNAKIAMQNKKGQVAPCMQVQLYYIGTNNVLHWNQQRHKKTNPFDKSGSIVATIWTEPDYTEHHAFAAQAGDGFDENNCYATTRTLKDSQ
jgi:hypothetical protein